MSHPKNLWQTKKTTSHFNFNHFSQKQKKQDKKGRMTRSDSGEIISEFDGYHGWFWRNRNSAAVTVTLETIGNYIQINKLR